MKNKKTYIITFVCAEGDPIKIVSTGWGRKSAESAAEVLFYKVAEYRCIKRLAHCLG